MTSGCWRISRGAPSAIFWPWSRTTMRSQMPITTFMSCSTSRTVTPLRRICSMRSMSRRDSAGVSPAAGSSSSRSAGRDASAMAIARWRCSPYESVRASTSRTADIATRSRTSLARSRTAVSSRRCAAVRASADHTRGTRRACSPIITFSRTVRRGKRLVFWNVRVTPSRAIRCGGRPVSGRPRNLTRPPLGGRKPVIRLKQVVFPAPLGPIKPAIVPSSTEKLTSLTAVRPPNRTVRASTSSSDTVRPALTRASPESPQPFRHDDDRSHEERAEDHEPRPLGHPQVLGHEREDEGTEDRSRDAALAAHDDHADDGHRVVEGERGRINEVDVPRVNTARRAREDHPDHEGDQLEAERRDPRRCRQLLVLANGEKGVAYGGVEKPSSHENCHADQHQHQVVVPELGMNAERTQADMRNVRQSHWSPRDRGPVQHDQAQDLSEAKGDDGEVGALEPQRERADEESEDARNDRGQQQIDGERHAEVPREERGRVGSDAEERRVTERELAQIAEHKIESERHQDEEAGHNQHVTMIRSRQEQGQRARRRRRAYARGRPRRGHRAQAPRPNSPCGLYSSTTIRIT